LTTRAPTRRRLTDPIYAPPTQIPWNSFLYEEPLPVSWAERLDAAVKGVDSYGLPVFLQFPINGNDKRSCPASNASDIPGTTSPGVNDFAGCAKCFDYDIVRNPIASFVRQGFVNYALAVSYAFNTTETLAIVNFGIDANRFLEDGCSTAVWESYKEFTQQVYATLKELYPAMSLFPSFSLETMMQAQDNMPCAGMLATAATKPSAALTTCTKKGYAALAGIPRDAFAWSAFPSLPTSAGGAGIPAWYLTLPLGATAASDRLAQVVANTGVLATDLALNFANTSDYSPPLQCTDFVTSDNDVAAAWFAQIMAISNSAQYRAFVVNYRTARDTLFAQAMACPCAAPLPALQGYCDVLVAYRGACKAAGFLPAACEIGIKVYGTLGVRDLFGSPREPFYSALQAERAKPY
jgi:hypothetical protein